MTEIAYAERVPDCEAYLELFNTTGWNGMYRATAGDLQRSLTRSWHAISAIEGKNLIGFGRLLSDGVLYAVVFDVIVAPDRQRQGIGTAIMKRLLQRCEAHGMILRRSRAASPREAPDGG